MMKRNTHPEILIVVNVLSCPQPQLTRRLEWLATRFMAVTSPVRCRLVYYGNRRFNRNYAERPDAEHKWTYFQDWQALYSYILEEGFFQGFWLPKRHFDFALMLRLADDDEGVFDWGLINGDKRRCILRAMFLAARGNVLFGHWGSVSALNPQSEQALFQRSVLHAHLTAGVHNNRFPDLELNRPFMKVFDHYLVWPTSIDKETLRDEHLEKIDSAIRHEYFTPQQLLDAQWNAHFHLYFAQDGYDLIHHRWKYFDRLHLCLIRNYIRLRSWMVSASWLEMFGDIIVFIIFAMLFVFLRLGTQRVLGDNRDELHQLALRYIGWIGFWETLFFKNYNKAEYRLWIRDLCRVFGLFVAKFSVFDIIWVTAKDRLISTYNLNGDGTIDIVRIWIVIGITDMATMFYAEPKRNAISGTVQAAMLSAGYFAFDLNIVNFAGISLEAAAVTLVFGILCFIFRDEDFQWIVDWEIVRSFVAVPLIIAVIITVAFYFLLSR